MDKKQFLDISLVIPLLTVFAFVSIYYYELGQFICLHIPIDFIKIDAIHNANLLLLFLASILLLLMLAEPFKFIFALLLTKQKNKYHYIALAILIPFGGWMLYQTIDWPKWLHFEILAPLCILIFGIAILVIKKETEPNWRSDDYFFLSVLRHRYRYIVGPIFTIGSLVCLVMYQIGYDRAKHKNYVYSSDHKIITLRNYSDQTIYGLLDTNSQIELLVIFSASRNDTILYNKEYWQLN